MATDEKKPRKIKIGGMSIEAKGDLRKKTDKKIGSKEPEAKPAEEPTKAEVPDIGSKDVAAREFTQRVKGYDPQEVKEFLEMVAVKMAALEEQIKTGGAGVSDEVVSELNAKIEVLEKENAQLKAKLASAGSKGDETSRAAKIIARAEELAERIKMEAEEEARHRIQEAELEASGKRAELEKQLDELKNEVQRLSHLKEDFISRVEQTLREFNDIISRYKR